MLPYAERLPNTSKDWILRRWSESIKFGCGGKGEIESITVINEKRKITHFLYSN